MRRGNLKHRLFCTLIALVMIAGLAAVASANMEKQMCVAHAEHDPTCGYVEAHPAARGVEAVEGLPCTHACALCDPVDELKDIKVQYDKYTESIEHKDVNIPYQKNHDVLKEIQTYVYNEAGARMQDDEGDFVKISLTKEVDYMISATENAEGMEEVTFKNSYLDSLYLLPYTYIFQFESGQNQEVELTITDTTSQKEEEPKTEKELPKANVSEGEEISSENQQDEAVDKGKTETEKAAVSASVGAYSVTMNASSISEDVGDYPARAERTGILQINANLSRSGETGRYMLIQLPAYGFRYGNTLPGASGGITAVIRIDSRTLRVNIADWVDETLNLEIDYQSDDYSYTSLLNEWRNGNAPAATGFRVSVYGMVSSIEQELVSKSYGNWKLNPSGTDPAVSMRISPLILNKYWPDTGISDFMSYLNAGKVSNFADDRGAFSTENTRNILNAIEFNMGVSKTYGGNSRSGYLKSVKIYADPVLLRNIKAVFIM